MSERGILESVQVGWLEQSFVPSEIRMGAVAYRTFEGELRALAFRGAFEGAPICQKLRFAGRGGWANVELDKLLEPDAIEYVQ